MITFLGTREEVELLVAFAAGDLCAGVVDELGRGPGEEGEAEERVGHRRCMQSPGEVPQSPD